MFRGFFDTAAVDALAQRTCDELRRHVPPADLAAARPAAATRLAEVENRMTTELQALAVQGLNVFQKARLGAQLRLLLQAAGYPTDFARATSLRLLGSVARR